MAFFLIGKGPGDDLRVLSTALFASRADAMAELSRLSAEPTFDQWDAEVMVMDLDAGVPVLLVRPQAAANAETTAEPSEGSAAAWEADLPAAEPKAAASEAEVAATAAEETEVPAENAPEAPEAEAGERDELREAILRTTQAMSAEGIVPPASAGHADTEGETVEETPVEQASAQEPVTPAETEPAEDTSTLEAAFGAFAASDEPAAPAWPWASKEAEPAASAVEEIPEPADVYSALEEPVAIPEGESGQSDAGAEAAEGSAFDAMVAPVSAPHSPMSSGGEEEVATTPAEAEESDFILDLDQIHPAVDELPSAEPAESEVEAAAASEEASEPEQPSSAPVASPLTEYTCDDCVYVATCPNRDQRAPKDCGSFQWK